MIERRLNHLCLFPSGRGKDDFAAVAQSSNSSREKVCYKYVNNYLRLSGSMSVFLSVYFDLLTFQDNTFQH